MPKVRHKRNSGGSPKIARFPIRQVVPRLLNWMLKLYQDAVVSGELELIEDASDAAKGVQSGLRELKKIASPTLVSRITKFNSEHVAFTKLSSEIYPKLMGDDASDEIYEQSFKLAEKKKELRQEGVAITVAIADELSSKMDNLVTDLGKQKIFNIILGISIIGIIILMASFLIKKYITALFKEFIEQVKILSSGDLTVRFNDQNKDEFSQLGGFLNRYVEDLMESIRRITQDSSSLDELAAETQQSAEEIQSNSDEIASQANSVSSAGEGLSSEIRAISENADEMSNSTISVAGAIEEMSAAISEVAVQCAKQSGIVEEANVKAESANQLMEELGEAAKEIQKIVEIINAIAAQTNLLALNATIEAASAGEAGKGFAVVANEVKELARQSSDSSDRIRTQIQNIHEKTQASLTAVTDISQIMEKVSQYSNAIGASIEEQSSTNQEISSTMQSVSGFTEEVNSTVKSSSDSAESVAENIRGVNDRISLFKSLADNTLDRAMKLSELSKQMRSAVNQFKTE